MIKLPYKLILYSFTIFSASAALMIIEIVAARLLAPYVGVSLYTWTTLIGVILSGLSLGNWVGGIWADRGADQKAAGLTLIFSGLLCLASLLFLNWLAPLLQELRTNLILANLIYVSALFFLPALLLGIISPLLTALALKLDNRTGHILGQMHALAALGSIVGTFASGYWLVQFFGTRNVLIATALGLLLLALPLLWSTHKLRYSAMAAILIVIALFSTSSLSENPCEVESNYFCIRIVDEQVPIEFGEVRSIILDHLSHGTNVKDSPSLLLSPYVHAMDELIQQHFSDTKNLRYFFAGGGAYTLPRAIKAKDPDAEIHIAELDPSVTKIAIDQLYIQAEGFIVHHQDARPNLNTYPDGHFDVIIGDVFHDIAIPYHLVTQEFLSLSKSKLKPNGIYLMNVVDAFPNPQLVKSLLKTAKTQFQHVHIWLDKIPNESKRMTYVISAGDSHLGADRLIAQSGLRQQWFRVNSPLLSTGTPLSELPLLTDNYAPVDRLLSSLLFSELAL